MRSLSSSASASSASPNSTPAPARPHRRSAPQASGPATGSRSSRRTAPNFFEVVCGLAKLGAVGVPVNWRLAAPELLHIIDDAEAKVVVVGSEFFGHVESIEDRLEVLIVAIGDH